VEGWSSEQVVAFLDKLGEFRLVQPMHHSLTSKCVDPVVYVEVLGQARSTGGDPVLPLSSTRGKL
jgi:hypothetical protein